MTVPADAMQALDVILAWARDFWILFGPGGKLHPAYFLEHKGHLVIEGVLVVIILYMFLQHSFKPRPHSEDPLTEKVLSPPFPGKGSASDSKCIVSVVDMILH